MNLRNSHERRVEVSSLQMLTKKPKKPLLCTIYNADWFIQKRNTFWGSPINEIFKNLGDEFINSEGKTIMIFGQEHLMTLHPI